MFGARHILQASAGRHLQLARSCLLLRAAARRTMAEMPVPQSSKAILFEGHPRQEGWESTMAVWYGSSLLLLIATLGMTPETEIETWARQEAAIRLGMQGEDLEFGTHYMLVNKQRTAQNWEKFSVRATNWGEEDDDEED